MSKLIKVFMLLAFAQSTLATTCMDYSASVIVEKIQQEQLTAEQCLNDSYKAYKNNISGNIFISENYNRVELNDDGLLAGVPIAVKDIFDTKGMPTTAGTEMFKKLYPHTDAGVVARLKNAGASIVGKTNLHELSGGVTSMNPNFGYVHNPYNSNHTAGGSSGGSAAAVAANIVPIALGTDTAGSTRIPAALTGIYGFKPTLHRYPEDGIVPAASSIDTVGVLAKNLDDIILVDGILSFQPIKKNIRMNHPIRLGVPRDYFYEGLDPETRDAVDAYLAKLPASDFQLVDVKVGDWIEDYRQINIFVILFEGKRDLQRYLISHDIDMSFDDLVAQIQSPDTKDMYEMINASKISPRQYKQALQRRKAYVEKYKKLFDDNRLDAIIFPTTLGPARSFAELEGEDVTEYYTHNTIIANTVGAPALSIPIDKSSENLPIAIEIDGLPNQDEKLLAIGLKLNNLEA